MFSPPIVERSQALWGRHKSILEVDKWTCSSLLLLSPDGHREAESLEGGADSDQLSHTHQYDQSPVSLKIIYPISKDCFFPFSRLLVFKELVAK